MFAETMAKGLGEAILIGLAIALVIVGINLVAAILGAKGGPDKSRGCGAIAAGFVSGTVFLFVFGYIVIPSGQILTLGPLLPLGSITISYLIAKTITKK